MKTYWYDRTDDKAKELEVTSNEAYHDHAFIAGLQANKFVNLTEAEFNS